MKRILNLCSAATVVACAAQVVLAQDADKGPPEIVHHPVNPHFAGTRQPTTGSASPIKPSISYHRGPVMGTPTAYIIWYGNWNQGNGQDTPAAQQVIRDFLQSIGGSPYFQINTTYNGPSGNVTWGGETTSTYTPKTSLT